VMAIMGNGRPGCRSGFSRDQKKKSATRAPADPDSRRERISGGRW
jgi:hypothetical protein